jgi:hypothetical protein
MSSLLEETLIAAQEAAALATQTYLDENGGDNYPCGFAWVNIKPARGPLVKLLKEKKIGRTDDYYGGYSIWNPSGNSCQNMYAKEAGARAFAGKIKELGIKISVNTRLD